MFGSLKPACQRFAFAHGLRFSFGCELIIVNDILNLFLLIFHDPEEAILTFSSFLAFFQVYLLGL